MTAALASDDRIRIAVGGLALAYLRLLSEGDTLRASQALRMFQSYWNTTGAPVILGEVGELIANGGFDPDTYGAIYYSFQALGISGFDPTVTGRAADLPARYERVSKPPAAHPAWGPYNRAKASSIVNVGMALEEWIHDFELGLDGEPSLDWLDELAGDIDYHGPLTTIVGVSPSGGRSSYWPWAIGGAALLTVGVGLAYGLKKKRRR